MNEHFDWAFGYCAARGYAQPVAATLPSALWFDVGKPDQAGRFILGNASGEAATAAFAAVEAPHTYVDIAATRDAILPHIPPHWQPRDPMWLMVAGTDMPAARPTPDFTVEVAESANRFEAIARHADGSLAARGVLGIHGTTAVYDQIVTEPQFGRRGLGSAIMAELGRQAARRGVTECLLVATSDGKALYERLGWTLCSDIVSVISPPA
ncbi:MULTISPECIES: GNAT family N-acetyltransferase [unclassified Sphingopyxis]|uniref:GNAT family N-acetyltransferase n=1 Tax=unclassified Sphingopyxis TaxID=2614943 RepID=UPI00138F572A|nr:MULTISPECIES: GNAT family N-acetyltransferase [unclassified Sphingopyxis]